MMIRICVALLLACTLSIAYADSYSTQFTQVGVALPEYSVTYVEDFPGRPGVVGTLVGSRVFVRAGAEDVQEVVTHELSHLATLNKMENRPEEFRTYVARRVGTYNLTSRWHNLTCAELGVQLAWYRWYMYTLTPEEVVAEDLRNIVSGKPTNLRYTIGEASPSEKENLLQLIK